LARIVEHVERRKVERRDKTKPVEPLQGRQRQPLHLVEEIRCLGFCPSVKGQAPQKPAKSNRNIQKMPSHRVLFKVFLTHIFSKNRFTLFRMRSISSLIVFSSFAKSLLKYTF